MKDYVVLDELISKTQELHRAIFDKGYEQGFKDGANSEYEHDHDVVKAYNDGQAFILDKIRAEIDQDAFKDVNGSKYIFVNRINQIIDKYREVSD